MDPAVAPRTGPSASTRSELETRPKASPAVQKEFVRILEKNADDTGGVEAKVDEVAPNLNDLEPTGVVGVLTSLSPPRTSISADTPPVEGAASASSTFPLPAGISELRQATVTAELLYGESQLHAIEKNDGSNLQRPKRSGTHTEAIEPRQIPPLESGRLGAEVTDSLKDGNDLSLHASAIRTSKTSASLQSVPRELPNSLPYYNEHTLILDDGATSPGFVVPVHNTSPNQSIELGGLKDNEALDPVIVFETKVRASESAPGPLLSFSSMILQGNEVSPLTVDSAYKPFAPFRILVVADRKNGELELRLDPPDLGLVTLRFYEDDSGVQRAAVAAENAETLDLLRRHSDVLQRELARAGAGDIQLGFPERHEDAAFSERKSGRRASRFGEAPQSLVVALPLAATKSESGRIDRFA
jgi:hypothetical protein